MAFRLPEKAFADEHARFEWDEAKAGRYLTAVSLVSAATALKFEDLSRLVFSPIAPLWLRIPLGLASLTAFVLAVGTIYYSLRVMSVEQVPALPVDHQIPHLFEHEAYDIAMKLTAQSFRTEATAMRHLDDRRGRLSKKANRLALLFVPAAVLSAFLCVPARAWDGENDRPRLPVETVPGSRADRPGWFGGNANGRPSRRCPTTRMAKNEAPTAAFGGTPRRRCG